MSIIRLLFQFLGSYRRQELDFSFSLICRTWAVFYVGVLLYTFLIMFFLPQLQDSQPVKLQEFINSWNIFFVVLLGAITGPFMEELLFRAGMKWWGKNISWLAGALLLIIIKLFFSWWIQDLVINDIYRSLIYYLIYFLCAVLSFWLLKPWFPKLSRAYSRWQGRIFWILTIGFGLVHLTNFELVWANRIIVLLVVPQMLLWIMLGFVRMQWWLGRSMIVHMFHNLIQIIPLLLLRYFWIADTNVQKIDIAYLSHNYGLLILGLYFLALFSFVSYQCIKEIIAFSESKTTRNKN